jgi:hypothetical protein
MINPVDLLDPSLTRMLLWFSFSKAINRSAELQAPLETFDLPPHRSTPAAVADSATEGSACSDTSDKNSETRE